jgi:hypothetical protein
MLVAALLFTTIIAIGLSGYLSLSTSALRLSQQTYYQNSATNLAEAGLEEALYRFKIVDLGTTLATAWSGWSIAGGNASRTLTDLIGDGSAIGAVKVYVTSYSGQAATASIIAQATVTPLDGNPPVRKTLKITLQTLGGGYNGAIVTSTSLALGANATVDSFDSLVGGAHAAYPGAGTSSNGNVIAMGGTLSLGAGALVKGSVLLGTGVSPPSASQVTGSIITNYSGSYPTPAWPSLGAGGGYYGLLSFPATLPRAGDTMAADGRYYYYPAFIINPLTLGSVAITAGKNVTIVASSVSGGLTLEANATCIIWTGNVTTNGNSGWTNPNWAGALQIYSWGSSVSIGHSVSTTACIYAPLATVSLTGGGNSPTYTGSIVCRSFSSSGNGWSIRYDKSLATLDPQVGTGSTGLQVSKWYDLQGTTEAGTLATLTGGFLN